MNILLLFSASNFNNYFSTSQICETAAAFHSASFYERRAAANNNTQEEVDVNDIVAVTLEEDVNKVSVCVYICFAFCSDSVYSVLCDVIWTRISVKFKCMFTSYNCIVSTSEYAYNL